MKLTKEALQRMEGLVNQNKLNELMKAKMNLRADLIEDGFEEEDVKAFIMYKLGYDEGGDD